MKLLISICIYHKIITLVRRLEVELNDPSGLKNE